ncbi:hypothetical protein GGR56DRAFT_640689 [Xylariaceae sp. FL0804]|nr:hypothetical protein GGR56DRAFT_640689 [Xylariaceae sp. FL0804]
MFDLPDIINTILVVSVTIILTLRLFNLTYRPPPVSDTPVIMHRRGGAHMPFRRVPVQPPQPSEPPRLRHEYEPSPSDCARVSSDLIKATGFPPELVDIVMDFASYWACSVASIDYTVLPSGCLPIYGTRADEDKFMLRTEPFGLTRWHPDRLDLWRSQAVPRPLEEEYAESELEKFIEGPKSKLEHPVRKIVFDITSKDQGTGGDPADRGTFRYSWTWFDVGIDRFDKQHESSESGEGADIPCSAIRPVWPPLREDASAYDHALHADKYHMIQSNRLAHRPWQHHHIEWSWTDDIDPASAAGEELERNGRGAATGNGAFLRNIKLGDMITVWGRARFGGWRNMIQNLEIRVYWAL